MSKSTGAAVAQAASTVLITLAAGQFLMTLDSSVMNVAIATVAEDVGTTITGIQTAITLYTLVMAMLMVTGGKIGSMIGRRTGVRDRMCDLRPRVADHRVGPEPAGAHPGLVGAGGHRRRADPAGDRRARRRELRRRGAAESLWPGDGRRRHRRRGRAADRRHRHDLLLLAMGVRRRGAGRRRDPAARSAGRRRTTGGQGPVRPGRRDPGRARARIGRLRGAALLGVGVGDSEAGRAVLVGHVPDDLAGPRRPADRLDLPGVGVPRAGSGAGTLGATGPVRQPSDDRRPADVLPALPRAGRTVLHDSAVPVGLAGPVRAGHRATDPAAVGDAARRGRRHPPVLPHRFAAPGGPLRAAGDVPGRGRPARGDGRRRRTPGSSQCRCCLPGWGSARWPRSWAR